MPVPILRATCILVIGQFFGWRANTTMSLLKKDIVKYRTGYNIYSSKFKTLGPGGLPMGHLKIQRIPVLI